RSEIPADGDQTLLVAELGIGEIERPARSNQQWGPAAAHLSILARRRRWLALESPAWSKCVRPNNVRFVSSPRRAVVRAGSRSRCMAHFSACAATSAAS